MEYEFRKYDYIVRDGEMVQVGVEMSLLFNICSDTPCYFYRSISTRIFRVALEKLTGFRSCLHGHESRSSWVSVFVFVIFSCFRIITYTTISVMIIKLKPCLIQNKMLRENNNNNGETMWLSNTPPRREQETYAQLPFVLNSNKM